MFPILVVAYTNACLFVTSTFIGSSYLPPANTFIDAGVRIDPFLAMAGSPEAPPDEDAAVADGVFRLGQLLRRALPADDNAVLSPLSVAGALSLALLASKGDTRTELSRLLGTADETLLGRRLSQVTRASGDVEVDFANALFVSSDFTINSQYAMKAMSNFSSEVQNQDFRRQGDGAQKNINSWVENKTKNKIKNLLDSPPDPETAVIIVNALYFNGAWEIPFPEDFTSKRPFSIIDSSGKMETFEVLMMANSAALPYARSVPLRAQILGLPYKGGEYVMYVVLPDSVDVMSLKNLEDQLTPELLEQLISSTVTDTLTVLIPKMTLEASLSLGDSLQAAGVRSLFDPATSDLSGLSEGSPPRPLYANEVLHKVRIEVTETGTVAAAATAVAVTRSAMTTFRADHPFLFYIQHRPTKLILFQGSVVRPMF